MKKLFLCTFLLMFAVAPSAHALTFGDGGAALQNVLDGIATDGDNDVDVNADMIDDSFDSSWSITATGTSAATLIIELAGFANANTFGVYSQGQYVQLFAGADTAGSKVALSLSLDGSVLVNFADTGVDFAGNNFGYYLGSPEGTFHSDTALNADGVDHMAAYQGVGETVQLPNSFPGAWTDNEFILAFEDLLGGGDRDYTDFVVMVESVQPIPEPATMLLLGMGLLGLGAVSRKKIMK